MSMHLYRRLLIVSVTALLVAACADSARTTTPSGPASSSIIPPTSVAVPGSTERMPGPTTGPVVTAAPVNGGDVLRVGDGDNGGTVRATPGQTIELVLGSTYWHIDGSSDPSVLTAAGDPVSTRGECTPGSGCGTLSQRFVGAGRGSATLSASRTTCGEARACSPDQGRFAVTVTVG